MWECENLTDQLGGSPVIIMSYCPHHGSSINSSTTQHVDVCALLSSALLTHGAILKSKLTWEDTGESPGQGEWRLNVQTPADGDPEPANRGLYLFRCKSVRKECYVLSLCSGRWTGAHLLEEVSPIEIGALQIVFHYKAVIDTNRRRASSPAAPGSETMEEINNIEVVPCTESDYLKPLRVHYNQNGTKKSWDFMRTHDSVSVLIFNTTSHCFVLVKQFVQLYTCVSGKGSRHSRLSLLKKLRREPPKPPLPRVSGGPVSLRGGELFSVAPGHGGDHLRERGLVDKPDLSLEEIARQEVLEECGYDVPASKLKRITSYRSGILEESFSTNLSSKTQGRL
ncbi:Uridine diphosphate glucose pyrophosphatase [Larimichthys crocea]|uniref:Uridine diphosphate glucose pyrophosphatase n=1 Tax=Larimichthys crocea TaxID=215358 RepID=A0A6G0I5I2_LARCR|nr:Uridine diphosphate glucose pyrophosphatase [Larimichthys crocea]